MLCTVLNHFCSVDTIDDSVTGSFQQIDLNRHMEEISHCVENVAIVRLKKLALTNSVDQVCNLLEIWECYTKLLQHNGESGKPIISAITGLLT